MKTISIANFKGGVAKTVSAANIAHILAVQYGKRVLLVDNDPQGNLSRLFNLYDYDSLSITEAITAPHAAGLDDVIAPTEYERLDLIPANLTLIQTGETRSSAGASYSGFLDKVADRYDYCIIDNAPTAGIYLTRALAASDEVLIPVTIDQFAIDGLSELSEQVNGVAKAAQRDTLIAGAFITNYQQTNAQRAGVEWLRNNANIRIFTTVIRRSVKITESTIYKRPVTALAPRSNPAKDYAALVCEYLNGDVDNG
jgi:chromosome partitioning protein